MLSLSPRLQAVLDLCRSLHTPSCDVLADIGTDHGYLPIAAVQRGICNRAIACDLHAGPLSIAANNINDAGLTDKITVRLGDGLLPLTTCECDCIVVAGMGGMRIKNIIYEGMQQARAARRLILQPQHDTELLRRELHINGFEIESERLIRETIAKREHFYVVMAAKYTGEVVSWTGQEYFLGKYLISEAANDFMVYKSKKREKIVSYISSIRDKKMLSDAQKRLEWLV
ncbi:MAG: class I SAM-dependent methyltransferase [Defluviitaleaceae bacterium]|nr:class I SAM-dependent methyltransferase [Defluviitaleaceae bacterium]